MRSPKTLKPTRRNKYGNKKCKVGNQFFDSKREAERYLVLSKAERVGLITDLRCQVCYELLPNQYTEEVKHLKTKDKLITKLLFRRVTYTADFTYYKAGKLVVEDVKISKYLLPKEFSLKMKMMNYFHGICVRCVYKADEEI